jgi:hypothetical protein
MQNYGQQPEYQRPGSTASFAGQQQAAPPPPGYGGRRLYLANRRKIIMNLTMYSQGTSLPYPRTKVNGLRQSSIRLRTNNGASPNNR